MSKSIVVIIGLILFGFFSYGQRKDTRFYSAKKEGSFAFSLLENYTLRFKHFHGGLNFVPVGTWSRRGNSIYFDLDTNFFLKENYFMVDNKYFMALIPLDSMLERNKQFLESIDIDACISPEIQKFDSLINLGMQMKDVFNHPRTYCILDFFLETRILVSPKNIYKDLNPQRRSSGRKKRNKNKQ